MVNHQPTIAVLYHIFYEDSFDQVLQELLPLKPYQPFFLFNICSETPGKHTLGQSLKQHFSGCAVFFTSNTGKDIGGKLVLFQALLQLEIQPDYLLLLHDKKSLQALKSATWKNDLLKIIEPPQLNAVMQYFEQNCDCGLLATKEYIITEPFLNNQFTATNGALLTILLAEYGIRPLSFHFVAGTMFWARAAPMLAFFRRFNPLDIRNKLEHGNVIDNFSGTVTHSWERLLCWIITAENLTIKGI